MINSTSTSSSGNDNESCLSLAHAMHCAFLFQHISMPCMDYDDNAAISEQDDNKKSDDFM